MIDLSKLKKVRSDKIWFFRFKRFNKDSYLITNDVWEYSFLINDEFWDFLNWKISDSDKLQELRTKWFIISDNSNKESIAKYATKNQFYKFQRFCKKFDKYFIISD